MPYSVDPDVNKENAMSPSEYLTVNEQLMYKLASLDATVQGGFRRLDEKMDRFQKDLHETQLQTNDRISELDKELTAQLLAKTKLIEMHVAQGQSAKTALEDRLIKLETWREVLVAKMTVVITGIMGLWTLVAPTVRDVLGISNG